MPLADAFTLLRERSIKYKTEEFKVVPEVYKKYFNSILENRFMTDSQYQSLVDFLHRRWKTQRLIQNKSAYEDGKRVNVT